MKLLTVLALILSPVAVSAQQPPVQMQPGIGPTGSMYNGNNLVRSPIEPRPDPNRPAPASGGGVTGAQSSRTEGGTGAGGGEH